MKKQNFFRDENGAVMVEFVIVFPFLAMIMAAILYYVEVTRFQSSALQLAQTQTWRAAAIEQAGLSPSDNFGFAGTASSSAQSMLHPRAPGLISEFKDSGHDYVTLLSNSGGFDAARTAFLVPPNRSLWQYLAIDPNTFDRNQLNPATLGVPGSLQYRNRTFTRPLLAFSNSFVGKSNEVTSGGLADNEVEFSVAPALPMIHDPFSIFWGEGEPHGGKIQRLRNVDRYTITSDPIYLAGLVMHGMMTMNTRSMSHLTNEYILRDLYAGAGGGVGGADLGAIMDVFSVVGKVMPDGGSKHAQPLWKVDKNADTQQHDSEGTVTYGGTEWGKKITERHRLNQPQSQNDRWSMIQ